MVPTNISPKNTLTVWYYKEKGNLSYVTMTANKQDERLSTTPREIELQNQIDSLQGLVTELHKARDATADNLELISEVQVLKDTLGEQSKLLEQSVEKLPQLEAEKLALREENQALNTTSNKRQRFQTQIRPMQPL